MNYEEELSYIPFMESSILDSYDEEIEVLVKKIDYVLITEELTEEDFQDIKDLFNYIKSRHISLKDDIADEEEKRIESYIENQYQKNIFILKNGEIEDYFNEGHFDIERAIEMAQSMTQDSISEEIKSNFTKVFNH